MIVLNLQFILIAISMQPYSIRCKEMHYRWIIDVSGAKLFLLEEKINMLLNITVNQGFLDFSLTVKAATLIFISGRGSVILSAKQGKSGSICNLVNNK